MPVLNMEEVAKRLDGSNIAISVADASQNDMPLTYVNPAFCAATGYDAARFLGQNCRFLQADLENNDSRQIIRDALIGGASAQAVFRNRRADGTEFSNLLIIEPLKDRDNLTAYVVGAQFVIDRRTRVAAAVEHGDHVVREIDKMLELNDRLRSTSRQALARSVAATVRLWMDR